MYTYGIRGHYLYKFAKRENIAFVLLFVCFNEIEIKKPDSYYNNIVCHVSVSENLMKKKNLSILLAREPQRASFAFSGGPYFSFYFSLFALLAYTQTHTHKRVAYGFARGEATALIKRRRP